MSAAKFLIDADWSQSSLVGKALLLLLYILYVDYGNKRKNNASGRFTCIGKFQFHFAQLLIFCFNKASKRPCSQDIMKIVRLFLSIAFASAEHWNCDERCGQSAYNRCMNNRRELELGPMEDNLLEGEPKMVDVKALTPKQEYKNIRGKANHHRLLRNVNFQLRMYHENSKNYCWQGEWEGRAWCLQCMDGDCSKGQLLQIRSCDDGEGSQLFVYERVPGTGGGRIKPFEDQTLCWMRTGNSAYTLEECDDINDGVSESQIFMGFDWDADKFQLHPSTFGGHCMTQDHYPRSGEVIYSEDCYDACDVGTCYWELIIGDVFGNDESGNYESGNPPVQFMGWSACSEADPCPQCHGDCDSDDECLDDLECYKRGPGEKVPSCSGGEDIDGRKYGMLCALPLENHFRRLTLGYDCFHLLQSKTFAFHPNIIAANEWCDSPNDIATVRS